MSIEKLPVALRRMIENAAEAERQPAEADGVKPSVTSKTIWKPKRTSEGLELRREKSDTYSSGPATVGQQQSQGVSVNGDGATVSADRGFSAGLKSTRGYGVSFSVTGKASASQTKKSADGMTSWTTSVDLSVQAQAGVSAPIASASSTRGEGIKASYDVRVPTSLAANVDPVSVNPFMPEAMPKGAIVTLDGARYSSSEFKATFRQLALKSKLTSESGVSVAIEKLEDQHVRITSGPTEAVKDFSSIGVDVGVASASLGRTDKLGAATLQTVELDLRSPDGRAAYNQFLLSGELPDGGDGVSNRATIEKFDYSSTPELALSLGSAFEAKLSGGQTVGSRVTTRSPDGTANVATTYRYPGNVPMTMIRKFDARGDELRAERRYGYTLKVDETNSYFLRQLLGATVPTLTRGQTMTLTYDEADMTGLMLAARTASKAPMADLRLQAIVRPYDRWVEKSEDFAIALARNIGQTDAGFVERLHQIAGSGNAGPLPRVTIAAQ